jgi:hypothetical protein
MHAQRAHHGVELEGGDSAVVVAIKYIERLHDGVPLGGA